MNLTKSCVELPVITEQASSSEALIQKNEYTGAVM